MSTELLRGARAFPPQNRVVFFAPAAKDFFASRKYACEDALTNEGAGVATDDQSSLIAGCFCGFCGIFHTPY